jgi:acid phosphatase (class A)
MIRGTQRAVKGSATTGAGNQVQESGERLREVPTTTSKLVALISLVAILSGFQGVGIAGTEQDPYLPPASVDLALILAPPPAPDSTAGKADLQAMIDTQKNRTPADVASAQADAELSVFRFADVIGPGFTAAKLTFAAKFFDHVHMDAAPLVRAAKLYFNRPRPFTADPEIHPVVGQPSDPSYPSGHSTFAYVDGIILANMLPEKAAAIFDRAGVYAHNRVVGGVHYPSDVEAGRISASVIDNVMLHDANFMAAYVKARTEVRKSVGLQ